MERKDGSSHPVHLLRLSSVPIKRHTKIKSDANPYDPTWEPYFEARLHTTIKDTLNDRIDLQLLKWPFEGPWQRQLGICPRCEQPLTPDTPWERHHVVWHVYGGTNALDNLQLLHQNCHRQIHAAQTNRD